MSAIYLHIPFCKRLCGYCDFFKSVKLQQLPEVVEAMKREIVERREYLGDSPLQTIYFGGGTPSLLSPQEIGSLLEVIASCFDLRELSEVTLEANPDDLTFEYLSEIRSVGVNRLSVGVQSFCDDELRFMNRRHSSQQAIEAVRRAQSVGFDNITIDLIFGVDGFDSQVLSSSIDAAISLGVQHISAYHLTVEEGTPFARKRDRGEISLVEDEVSQKEYELMERKLTEAGFEHYEISNYAQKGYRSKHNSSYWHGVHYLGIGPAAHSFNGVERRYAVDSIEKYLLGGENSYSCEVLSTVDRYNELVMTSLRCAEGVDLEILKKEFDVNFSDHFESGILPFLKDGKIKKDNNRVYIPTKYFLIADFIIESLFWV